jgi:hypothetical protein
MGFLERLKQTVVGANRIPVVEANAGRDIDGEWLRGRFSSMVVGESNYVNDFVNAYAPHVWPEGAKRIPHEMRDMIRVELRRDPRNSYDMSAIEVWSIGSPRAPYSWLAGFVKREVAAKVAPVVDAAGISKWRHPAEIRGTVSLKSPMFGVSLLPGRLLTQGPDMSTLLTEFNVGYPPATEKQIDFVLSLLGADRDLGDGMIVSTDMSRSERETLLSSVGNPRDWRNPQTWAALDRHQISIAIDVLLGRALWVTA